MEAVCDLLLAFVLAVGGGEEWRLDAWDQQLINDAYLGFARTHAGSLNTTPLEHLCTTRTSPGELHLWLWQGEQGCGGIMAHLT